MEIRDSRGLLACKADADSGIVECRYKGLSVRQAMKPGQSLTIIRNGEVTVVIRIPGSFLVTRDKAS